MATGTVKETKRLPSKTMGLWLYLSNWLLVASIGKKFIPLSSGNIDFVIQSVACLIAAFAASYLLIISVPQRALKPMIVIIFAVGIFIAAF